MEYPNELYRGITSKNLLVDGCPTKDVFIRFENTNSDGFDELSICWNDDERALTTIRNQRNKSNGEIQFPAGIALLWRSDMDSIICSKRLKDIFKYERKKLEDNPYHGNLLFKGDSKLKSQLASLIALLCKEVL